MSKCPLSGLPCNHQKCIHVTEVNKNYAAKETFDMCALCGPSFIEANEPKLKHKNDTVPPIPESNMSSAISDTTTVPVNNLIDSLPPLVSDVLKLIVANKVIPQSKKEFKACPTCGYTIYDFTKTGRMGCGVCYEFFKEEISPIIESYHKSLKHKGKGPQPVPLVEKPTLETLEKELKAAIKQENYEEAAKLRDLIKKLN